MSEICFNSTRFARRWFENLDSIQLKMAELNHLTETNAKDFSKQTLGELLMPESPGADLRIGNLNLHCQQTLGLLVPDAAFEMQRTFLWFLGRISIEPEARLARLFHCVAQKFKPDVEASPTPAFQSRRLKEAFNPEPLANNPALKALDGCLRSSLSPAFYPDSSALSNSEITIKRSIELILF